MSNFQAFQKAVDEQYQYMLDTGRTLFVVNATKDELWDTYLGSFPEGSNPMFRERTEHDCQCCKQFVRRMGKVVCLNDDGQLQSVWHCDVDDPAYQAVADGMAALLETKRIVEPLYHYEAKIGTRRSTGQAPDGTVERWDHFGIELPKELVKDKHRIPTILSGERSSRDVFVRSCTELHPEAVQDVLDLIEAKTLYRGEEHTRTLKKFQQLQRDFLNLRSELMEEEMAWEVATTESQAAVRIRNTAIGTLLIDLSEGMDLEQAVGRYEAVVAPSNYKRPKALVTPAMIKKAQEAVQELGMMDSLPRRHAQMTDITVNNVIWADRSAKQAMQGKNVFEEMLEESAINVSSLDHVPECPLDDFLEDVGQYSAIEVLLENRLQSNLMSLVAPVHPDAPNMLKWDNNFTWIYNGDVADSMKQRVKAAGGSVDGVLRFSLQWNHLDTFDGNDLDAHCQYPRGHIYYGNKRPAGQEGELDVDIISPQRNVPAVENITWPRHESLCPGKYVFAVHMYSRSNPNRGFDCQLEFNGELFEYSYSQDFRDTIPVVTVTLDEKLNPTYEHHLPSQTTSRDVWGVQSMRFHRVSAVLNSPNHWDDQANGNKHLFMIIDGCKQPGDIRGFFNEQLTDELREHRKVFEVLGSKVKVEEADQQLSGLGFSSTQRNHAFVRVTDVDNGPRVLKLTF